GTALAVNGDTGNGFRQPGCQNGGTAQVEGLRTDLADTTDDHVVHPAGVDASAGQQCINHDGAQIGRVHLAQPAVTAASGGANGINNIGVCHRSSPHLTLVAGVGANNDSASTVSQ